MVNWTIRILICVALGPFIFFVLVALGWAWIIMIRAIMQLLGAFP